MKTALIDTNLLVLLVVGATDRQLITKLKCTNDSLLNEVDYDALVANLQMYQKIWITSHCLAETSNLLQQTNEVQAKALLTTLAMICQQFSESHMPKESIFVDQHYARLGVADTGFIQKSKSVTCSFTLDFDLYIAVSRLERNVVNFNHIRVQWHGI